MGHQLQAGQITHCISEMVQDRHNGIWFLLKANRKSYAFCQMVTMPVTLNYS